jgi:hypothetical protein
MLRSFSIGFGGYAASAVVFLAFSIFFVRTHGADDYGAFSLLLNTVSALTMFGNYHGALVSYSVAVDRQAFTRMLRPIALYAAAASLICAAALTAIGNLQWPLFVPAAIAFVCALVSGLPTSVLLASPANWMTNVARAAYQSLLILAFWILFALQFDVGTAFVLSLLLASATYLALLASRARFPASHPPVDPAPRAILLLALCWNLAHMAVMLTDKFAIRFLNVGADFTDAGVFLLYLDIAGRFSVIYLIGLPPLTYELLRRIRSNRPVYEPALIAVLVCVLLGASVAAIGQYLVPTIYKLELTGREMLPAVIGAYVTLMGLGSIILAYCNSAGRPQLLIWHYLGTFVTGAIVLGAIYIAGGHHISVTQLAIALAVGQAYALLTATILVAREKGMARTSARARELPAVSAPAKAQ